MYKYLIIIVCFVLQTNLYAQSNKLSTQNVASTTSCAKKEIPLSKPNQSDISILTFANRAILSAFSYDYKNHEDALNASSKFFTKKGWKEFLIALENSNNIDVVIKNKLTVSATPIGSPIITNKGILKGVYSWRVVMPVIIKYQNSVESSTSKSSVTILITRTPRKDSSNGIGITQFVAAPYKGFD